MSFNKGLWEHEMFMDVFIEVLKVKYQDSKKAKLNVRWWNKGWIGEPYSISGIEPLTILNFSGWRRADPIRTVTSTNP